MVSAKNLMIGDWVVGNNKQPFQIGVIDPSFRYWDDIEPIPLTQEILEKNGFVQTTGLEYAIGTTNDLEPLYYAQGKLLIDIGARCRSVCRICYVHQLQHALRLCGIEKEIVI